MNHNQMDPDKAHARRKDEVEHQTTQQAAADRARGSGFDPRELMSKEWMETVNDLDVDRDLPDDHPAQHNVGEIVGSHKSKQKGIGFITRDEYEAEKKKDRGRRRLINSKFRRRGGTGGKCVGRTRERLTGGEGGDLPLMSPDLSDQLDAGFDAVGYLRSGSVGGRRFKGSTEVQVVTKNENGLDLNSGGKKGLLGKVTGGLLG